MTHRRLAALCLLLGSAPSDERVTTHSKGVATSYVTRQLDGFTVHVDLRLLAQEKETGDAALAVLGSHLFQIERTVRPAALEKLRQIPLWLGLDDPVAPCACYHPSPEWLTQNGFDSQKAKSVELANAAHFITWTHQQPWMVLHALAHGNHDRFLRGAGAGDTAATEQARQLDTLVTEAQQSGSYDAVLHWNGGTVRHYALNNADEYFAEASEAWFGTNDFFPFVHAELVQHDPALAKLLARIWGEPQR